MLYSCVQKDEECDIIVAKLGHYEILSTAMEYGIESVNVSVSRIKYGMWKTFSDTFT